MRPKVVGAEVLRTVCGIAALRISDASLAMTGW